MIPLNDDLKTKKIPVVTWALLAINALVFMWQLGLPQRALAEFYHIWGMVPARLSNPDWAFRVGFPAGGILTIFTSMFIHGGWLHFIANSWTLSIFGDDVEERLGHLNYLLLYLASGIFAGLTHLFFFANSTVPVIGASGAIAGVMGAFLVLFPMAKINILVPILFIIDIWRLPAALYLPLWFFSQLFSGTFALIGAGFSSIAFWAHIGGFLAGMLLVNNLNTVRPKRQSIEPDIIEGPGYVIIKRPSYYQDVKRREDFAEEW